MGKICTDTLSGCFIGSESFAGVEYDIANSFGAFIPKIGSATSVKQFLGEKWQWKWAMEVAMEVGSGKIWGKDILTRCQDGLCGRLQ